MPAGKFPAHMPFRGFVAVSAPAQPPLVALLGELGTLARGVKAVEPHNLHFTLSFLGQVPDDAQAPIAAALVEAARGVAPFRAHLRGVGAFPSARRPRVVWAGVDDPRPLAALATRVREALAARGLAGDDKDFRAHLTLARVKSERAPDELVHFLRVHGQDELYDIDVREVRLYKSVLAPTGPTYEPLASAALEA